MPVQLEEHLAELQDLEVQVLQGWADRRELYQEELELQQLQRELEQAEHWLNTYENVLTAQDYGVQILIQTLLNAKSFVCKASYCWKILLLIMQMLSILKLFTCFFFQDSVSDVLELLKKQEDLEAMIQAQSDRFNTLHNRKSQVKGTTSRKT